MDLQYYLALEWTIRRAERHDDGDYFALTVKELPGFVVAGTTHEVEAEFWPALALFLSSYIEAGEEPPVPAMARKREDQLRRALEEARRQSPAAPPLVSHPSGVTTVYTNRLEPQAA